MRQVLLLLYITRSKSYAQILTFSCCSFTCGGNGTTFWGCCNTHCLGDEFKKLMTSWLVAFNSIKCKYKSILLISFDIKNNKTRNDLVGLCNLLFKYFVLAIRNEYVTYGPIINNFCWSNHSKITFCSVLKCFFNSLITFRSIIYFLCVFL